MDEQREPWPSVDIVCAFNYSCCCLHKRSDLVSYFKHARDSLSNKGGIFAMDLYGGISSELPLKLRRRFSGFTVSSLIHSHYRHVFVFSLHSNIIDMRSCFSYKS